MRIKDERTVGEQEWSSIRGRCGKQEEKATERKEHYRVFQSDPDDPGCILN